MKSARLGYSKMLVFAGGAIAATNPGSIIYLLPTDEDANDFVSDDFDPIFEASPDLRGLMRSKKDGGRNTLTRRALRGGGTIKFKSARAPRKLRKDDAKFLFVDEADAMEITEEGDPIFIAEKRTMAHGDRKIIIGSTPTEEGISAVERYFGRSDQRVFECPCPECGVHSEIQWESIRWDNNDPQTTRWVCPECSAEIEDAWKAWMVTRGSFRITKPEIEGHAGFRINALSSLLDNTSWIELVAEWLQACKDGPAFQQVFVNTVLGRTWKTSIGNVDASILESRVEGIGQQDSGMKIPADCYLITCGADPSDDKIDAVLLGWRINGGPYILGHYIFEGNTLEDDVWRAFDKWRRTKWRHPNGWLIGIDGLAVDSGGREGRTQKVYDWAYPRLSQRVYAIKGEDGPRRVWTKAKKVKGNMSLYLVAVDVMKTEVMGRLAREPFPHGRDGEPDVTAFRYSDSLSEEFFKQATNEVRRLRYHGLRPKIVFEPKTKGARVEALDCLVYATAVRQAAAVRLIDLRVRAARRGEEPDKKAKPKTKGAWAAAFNQTQRTGI